MNTEQLKDFKNRRNPVAIIYPALNYPALDGDIEVDILMAAAAGDCLCLSIIRPGCKPGDLEGNTVLGALLPIPRQNHLTTRTYL